MVSCVQDLQQLRRKHEAVTSFLYVNGTREVALDLWWVVDELPTMLKTVLVSTQDSFLTQHYW